MEKLQIRKFGITKDGSKPYLYKMKNDAGMEVQVSDFGATLVNVTVLDQDKNPVEVVLGYEDAAGYENGTAAIGAIVGRNANRIGGACVTINGIDYKLAENDGKNNLHSGPDVYQKPCNLSSAQPGWRSGISGSVGHESYLYAGRGKWADNSL